MTKDKPKSQDFSQLRRQAEERLAAKQREAGQPICIVPDFCFFVKVPNASARQVFSNYTR